jgi:hypothetical protein
MVRCAQKSGFANEEVTPHRSSLSVRGEPLERIEVSLSRAEWLKNNDGEPSINHDLLRSGGRRAKSNPWP